MFSSHGSCDSDGSGVSLSPVFNVVLVSDINTAFADDSYAFSSAVVDDVSSVSFAFFKVS